MAITQEDCITAHHAEKKQKAPTGPPSAQPPRYRLVQILHQELHREMPQRAGLFLGRLSNREDSDL